MEKFVIDGQYGKLLADNHIDPKLVLRQANLPMDTFAHHFPQLSETDYFKMLEAVDEISGDPMLPIRLVKENNLETFSPPILAAYCSQNGEAFIQRLAHYKKLIGLVSYQIEQGAKMETIKLHTLSGNQFLPAFFVKGEFAFLIEMLTRATGKTIKPVKVAVTFDISNQKVIDFFAITPQKDIFNSITFSRSDLQEPFQSKNLSLLDYLEPELKKRLAELDVDDSYAKRVRSVVVELLPRGIASADDVAAELGVSKRTLQRNLKAEGTNFQQQLNETREMLAKNYLLNTQMSIDEIAFLLAYQETNSFQRAFAIWTGKTAQQCRQDNIE